MSRLSFEDRVYKQLCDRRLPHAVYRAYADDGELLYVGCTINPKRRLRAHRNNRSPWYPELARVVVVWHVDFRAAMDAEKRAIKTENPRANLTSKPGYWRGRPWKVAA